MNVFRAEIDDGVAEFVRGSRSTSATRILASSPTADPLLLDRLCAVKPARAVGSREDFDLFYLESVLVSTGWNLNDDVFDPAEVWVARRSPEDKQLNYEHDCSQIVGHMTSAHAATDDENLTPLPDDLPFDDVPEKFHVVTSGVLYKFWDKEDLQKRMDEILAAVASGELSVSMECLFKGFDYALMGRDKVSRIVARNEQTAYLTKHLRAYGGTGRYGEYRVGRVLRNITFSGKGLVKKPANPDSVILPPEGYSPSKAEFLRSFGERVYVPQTGKRENTMTPEQLQAEVDRLRAENAKLQEGAAAELKAKAAKSDELLAKASDEIKSLNDRLSASEKKLAETENSLADALAEVKSLHAEKTLAARVAKVKAELEFSDEDAAKFVETNAGLTDELFDAQVKVIAKALSVKLPPKGTPAPNPPKGTPAQEPPRSTGSEVDAQGEKNADAVDLEAGKASAPALTPVPPPAGVSDIQKEIAKYLGADLPEQD